VTVAGYPLHADPALESRALSVATTSSRRRGSLVAVGLLTILLSALFSSPDVKPVTVAQWATVAPKDFLTTALSELDGTSGVATYGPPYTHVAGAGQKIVGSVSIERALGVQIPIDTAKAFVLGPLSIPAQTNLRLARALAVYEHAARAQQQAWTLAFGAALDKGTSCGASAATRGCRDRCRS